MIGERSATLAGVLYVALDVVVGAMAGAPPPPSAPESEIVAYIVDHRAGMAAGLWLFGLATIFLLWWFGSLWVRTLGAVFLSAAGFGLGTHLIATNVLAIRAGATATWLVVAGLVAALAFLVSAVLGSLSTDTTSNTISFVGFVLWLVWILGISHQMWRDNATPDNGLRASDPQHPRTSLAAR